MCKSITLCDNKNHSQLSLYNSMHDTIELAALKPGETATISSVHADRGLSYRLAALGFRVGKRIEVIRQAKFSGPLHVRVGTTDVMLRRKEAEKITVLAS